MFSLALVICGLVLFAIAVGVISARRGWRIPVVD